MRTREGRTDPIRFGVAGRPPTARQKETPSDTLPRDSHHERPPRPGDSAGSHADGTASSIVDEPEETTNKHHRPRNRRRRAAMPGHGRSGQPSRARRPDRSPVAAAAEGQDDGAERRRRLVAEFRRRLEAGEFGELLDANLAGVMTQATIGNDLAQEIGALRVAIARVIAQLADEEDPTKLAGSLARLTTASVQAHRARHALGGSEADEFTQALNHVLMEINRPPDD